MEIEETEKTKVPGLNDFICVRCKKWYKSYMNNPGICGGFECHEKGRELGYKAK